MTGDHFLLLQYLSSLMYMFNLHILSEPRLENDTLDRNIGMGGIFFRQAHY